MVNAFSHSTLGQQAVAIPGPGMLAARQQPRADAAHAGAAQTAANLFQHDFRVCDALCRRRWRRRRKVRCPVTLIARRARPDDAAEGDARDSPRR